MKGAKKTHQQPLGRAVKRLRTELGISGSELARRAGLTRSYISYLESGRFKDVGLDKFARIAMALDISADQLLTVAGYMPADRETTDIRVTLRRQLGLSGGALDQAMDFLGFLTDKKKRIARAH